MPPPADARVEHFAETEGAGACGSLTCLQERNTRQQEAQVAAKEAAQQLAATEVRLLAAKASEEQLRAQNEKWQVSALEVVTCEIELLKSTQEVREP